VSRKSVIVNKKGVVTLPDFFKRGFGVVRDGDVVHMNLPGYSLLSDIPNSTAKSVSYKVAQFLITHFHPDASHNAELVAELESEFVVPTLTNGGLVPHETIKDWLFWHGKKNDLVGGY
jgi:hypothetical protein